MNGWPDPHNAGNAAEFVALMRQLRTACGLPYRTLAKQAARTGGLLPRSTLSTALSRDSLPRPELVETFVRACGGDDETVASWLTARARVATAPTDQPVGPDVGPPEPSEANDLTSFRSGHDEDASISDPVNPDISDSPPPPASRRRWVGVVGIAALGLLVATGFVVTRDRPPARTYAVPDVVDHPRISPVAGQPLASARYRIHVRHTGLCIGEGPELYKKSKRIVLGQHDCATTGPPISLEAVSQATYRIMLDNPQYGPGCTTVDLGGRGPELVLAGAACEPDRKDQTFTVEAVRSLKDGYRLRSVSGPVYCIGIFLASREKGMQLVQDRCDKGGDQIFMFERL